MEVIAPATAATEQTGLEDVVRSARALGRTVRSLGTDTAELAERELAMAIRIASDLRDQVVSKETLAEARSNGLASRIRRDAHDIVDLVVDGGAVTVLTVSRFVEAFVDEPRPIVDTSAPKPTVGRVVHASP